MALESFPSRFDSSGGVNPVMHLAFKDTLAQNDLTINPDRPNLAQLQEGLGVRAVQFALTTTAAHPESLVYKGYFEATSIDAMLVFSRLNDYRDPEGNLREVAIEHLAGDAIADWRHKPEIDCLVDLQMHYTSHDSFFFKAGSFAQAAFGLVYNEIES